MAFNGQDIGPSRMACQSEIAHLDFEKEASLKKSEGMIRTAITNMYISAESGDFGKAKILAERIETGFGHAYTILKKGSDKEYDGYYLYQSHRTFDYSRKKYGI